MVILVYVSVHNAIEFRIIDEWVVCQALEIPEVRASVINNFSPSPVIPFTGEGGGFGGQGD